MNPESREIAAKYRRLFVVFIITYTTQVQFASSAVSTCGGTLIGRTGTFTSPNYPFPPKKEPNPAEVRSPLSEDEGIVTCEWKIIVPDGLGIQLNFGDFDMAAGLDECRRGELEVFSGVGETKNSLDTYCGSDDLDKVQLKTSTATVIFRRPTDFSGKGFLVSYIATDPGETIDDFVTCVDRGSDHVGVGSFSVLCPGGCANLTELKVWGSRTESYRDNSYLCRAAVHAGVISDEFGGRINVQRKPGLTLYTGSDANGVETLSGAMSDYKLEFRYPDVHCMDKIRFQANQLTASSYWTTDDKKDKWKPDKGIFDEGIYAWSPKSVLTEQWLEVDLKEVKEITGISTRGSSNKYYLTKSYKVAFRNDTRSPWTYYREEGMENEKVFTGNEKIFRPMKNNFIQPRIIARFFRVYPTPVKNENERYALQIGLFGCSVDGIVPARPEVPAIVPITTKSTTKESTTSSTTARPRDATIPEILVDDDAKENTTAPAPTTNSSIMIPPGMSGTRPTPTISTTSEEGVAKDPPQINESSIIVIAIVAALAVTSILLAALVLILVRKRKKDPKDSVPTSVPLQQVPDNNNTFRYESKKSKKRRNQGGEHFQNRVYKESISSTLQHPIGRVARNPSQSATLPADQVLFLDHSHQNGGAPPLPNGNGILAPLDPHDAETDSFISDDDDHEYQVIPDELVVSDAPSMQRGSSKASTGSSVGNKSRNSETIQRTWGTAGDQWNKVTYPPNSPVFYGQNNHQAPTHPTFSTFSSPNHPHNGYPYPKPNPNAPQTSRPGTFPHDVHYSASSGQISDLSNIPPGLRRGSSQSPSRFQRHSTSSNNSSHSHPSNGVQVYPHDPHNPYYSSVPNGENCTVSALNHPGYLMYGDETIPEQHEAPGPAEERRKPSYKAPRQYSAGVEPPALPGKMGAGPHNLPQTNGVRRSDPSVPDYNGVCGPSRSFSTRSDYDRLYRGNSISSAKETPNNFSIFNGSQSQYHQLNLNAANV